MGDEELKSIRFHALHTAHDLDNILAKLNDKEDPDDVGAWNDFKKTKDRIKLIDELFKKHFQG